MQQQKVFTPAQLEVIAEAVGDTTDGLIRSELAYLLATSKIADWDEPLTMRKRLYNAFATDQNQRQHRRNILVFSDSTLRPCSFYVLGMRDPPYDRSLALASLVRTMRDHYLAIRCGCGAQRVITLARMADTPRVGGYTLAHVAMSLTCKGCHDGPDDIHLTATGHGLKPTVGGGDLVWTMPLVVRAGGGAKRLRRALG